MELRLRTVETNVSKLEDWRESTVDPWIDKSVTFQEEVGRFMAWLKGGEENKAKLDSTRHSANAEKANATIIAIGILALVVAVATCVFAYLSLRPH